MTFSMCSNMIFRKRLKYVSMYFKMQLISQIKELADSNKTTISCSLLGHRTRTRPIVRDGVHGGKICPHLEELQPCVYPACYSWKVIPSNKCTLKYPDMQCGEGMMNRTSICVGLNGVCNLNVLQ